ncbi:MAG: SAM-dependent methyltransferase [Flavobacteriales bacterium]
MSKGTLYLIPCTIGSAPELVIPASVNSIVNEIDVYVVENLRSARRFLSSIKIQTKIDNLTFYELGKHTEESDIPSFLNPAMEGKNIGLISEAGLPAVADPGGKLVAIAHGRGIKVKPFTGPSSLMLALMGSGFNGQNFRFRGYIPKERGERISFLKDMETEAVKRGISQIFMDTPFRNDNVLEDCLHHLSPKTYLNISADITMDSEFIRTLPVGNWKTQKPQLKKRPTVFIIGRPEYLY